MRQTILVALGLLLAPLTAAAQSITLEVRSDYVPQNGARIDSTTVIQLYAALPVGPIYFAVWGSRSADQNIHLQYGNELDLTVGVSGKVKSFDFDGSLTYLFFSPIDSSQGDMASLKIQASRPLGAGFIALTALEPYWPVHGRLPKRGTFVRNGISYASGDEYNLARFQALARADYDSGAFGNEAAWIGRFQAGIRFRLTSHLRAGPSLLVSTPLTDVEDGRKTYKVWVLGMDTKF